MKKVLNFLFNTQKGRKFWITICGIIIISLIVGLILSIPTLWLGGREYEKTWMSCTAPYFFYVFFTCAALFVFLFIPYMWYVGNSKKYKGDGRWFLKGMSLFSSFVPGGLIYAFVAKALLIPSGGLNLLGMFVCGFFYLWIIRIVFNKQFKIIQEFLPLD